MQDESQTLVDSVILSSGSIIISFASSNIRLLDCVLSDTVNTLDSELVNVRFVSGSFADVPARDGVQCYATEGALRSTPETTVAAIALIALIVAMSAAAGFIFFNYRKKRESVRAMILSKEVIEDFG